MKNDYFEKIYKKLYVDIIEVVHQQLKKGKHVHPSIKERQEIINSALSATNCTCRFIDDVSKDAIIPLSQNDPLYVLPAGSTFTNKDFFKLIHQSYLMPYLVYGGFSYRLASQLKAPRDYLLQAEYKIDLPLDFSGKGKNFFWYTQTSRILTLNEHRQIISHINTYEKHGRFKIMNGMPESRFVESTIFVNNELQESFQAEFEKEFCSYLIKAEVFTPAEMNVLKGKEKSFDRNKHIAGKMTQYTGYRFKDIYEICDYLESINFYHIAC